MKAEIFICESDKMWGRLHSRYLEAPYVFIDLYQMIHKMEEIFDTNRFPQAFLSPRTFKVSKSGKKKTNPERNDEMNQEIDQEMNQEIDINGDSGKCTFEITVRFRQNATWQGQVLWAEKNMRQNFRSVLEMLKLMDEALHDGDNNKKAVDWNTII